MPDIDTVTLLNRLIVTTKNCEAALRAASEEVYHQDLHDSLTEYSRFFADTAHELKAAVLELGGHPKGSGTFDNTLHRTWMHIKASITGHNEGVILDTVEADEREADARFEDALSWDTPPAIHTALERIRDGSRQRHAMIQELRGRLPDAA